MRVVAATNQDLTRAVAEKRFREDLFYRLNVVPIRVPPLRERLADLPLLVDHFLARYNRRHGTRKRLTDRALDKLLSHDYPGNVRELENLVEQAAALSVGDLIEPEDFTFARVDERQASAGESRRLSDVVDEAERAAILASIARHPGDLAAVARELGISPTTLWRKMKRLEIGTPSARSSA